MIFVIDDNEVMAKLIARNLHGEVRRFRDAYAAIAAIDEVGAPDLVFLDVLLNGPDGFTFLNTLAGYDDTVDVPVVIVSSLNLVGRDLSSYGVREILCKDTMRPEDVRRIEREILGDGWE